MSFEIARITGPSAAADAHQWVVLNTQPHREGVAVENLRRQQFSTYCPMVRRQVRHARKTTNVLRPLFPGYLFVGLEPGRQRWRPLLSTVGVRTLVRFGNAPAHLDAKFIECLKAREADGAVEISVPEFRIGQEVRFAGGAFDGLVATIVAMSEKDRMTLLLNLLQGRVRVTVNASALTAA